MVKVTETARRRPGKCALSGETQGPFLDTGQTVPRYGRVYISLKWLEQPLRELGYLKKTDVEELTEENKSLQSEVERLQEVEDAHRELVDSVTPYLPTPEPEVREVKVKVERKPTDEEIAKWIEKNGGDHPVVRNARRVEKGSYEEWSGLYGESGPQPSPRTPEPDSDEDSEEGETSTDASDEGPAKVVTVFDQDVDLDKVLAQNVGDVVSFTEGKGEEFEAALVRREYFIAERDERSVRKGVLEPLGYWDDEDDEPLIPLDEADEEETEVEDEDSDEDSDETTETEEQE